LGRTAVPANVASCRFDASTELPQGAVVRVPSRPIPPRSGLIERAREFGILSSFPPTACGLATFSAALAAGLQANGAEAHVVRVLDAADHVPCTERVVGDLVNGSHASLLAATELLNDCDVAVVQHEYGLYGGADGDEVLEILGGLTVPSIVVAHTILNNPTSHQRSVLNEVASLADQVVVMTEAARQRLCLRFDVDPDIVVTIPHGAAIPKRRKTPSFLSQPMLLTWGLIGPGKGIERAIEAMKVLHDLPMRPTYLVAGQTHPKVLALDGESYRHSLVEQARRLGVGSSVVFDDDYRDVASLTDLIQSSTVVVLPYDSKEQVTSGVLVDAIAAGRPVVSTAFPHATELLASGAGLVVDHDDPEAMARALRRILLEPDLASKMAAEAERLAPSMGWPVVAGRYVSVANRLLTAQPALV
jgi:glycosyltransferase involved in cell wall biosynthesis